MAEEAEKPPEQPQGVVRNKHTPNAIAILEYPQGDLCEMIITTTARSSHVYALTYEQLCLLSADSEKARLAIMQMRKLKLKKKT